MGLAIAMGAMAAGSALFGSMQQGQQQATNNAIQRAQFEEQEFQKKMNNQIKNRQIANSNAAKWMMNKNIGRAANSARAEEEFWLGYNFDNATGQFSRQYNMMNSSIQSVMQAKNISSKSGTARQIMSTSLEQTKKGLVSKRSNFQNSLISAERKQEAILAKRDFGYATQVKFMPSSLVQQSDSSIMSQALTTGLVTGAFAGASAGIQTSLAMKQAGYDPMGGAPDTPGGPGTAQSQMSWITS